MTEKRERWQGKEWYGKTKSRWQQPAGKTAVRAHTIRRNISQPQESEREISAEKDAVGTTVKEKTTTWNTSCTESTNRETGELYKMVEAAVMDEKQEQKERGMIRDLLEQLQKRREEEDEARNLIEEMQRNLHDALNKSYEVEQEAGPCSLGIHRSF